MENTEFSMSELYDCVIKATQNIEINGKIVEAGEVIAAFDKIQLANFQEVCKVVAARGGFDNPAHVIWETQHEENFQFASGVFSKTQFALMNNSELFERKNSSTYLHKREKLETDENGKVILSETVAGDLFIYGEEGEKLPYYIDNENHILTIQGENIAFKNLIVDYMYEYSGYTTMVVGRNLINGFVSMEAKTRFKDDVTGQTHTGIIRIPKMRIMSDFSMRLGKQANPYVGSLSAIGFPIGERGKSKIMEIIFLDDDIDSDM